MNKSLAHALHAPSLFLAAVLQVLPIARAALPVTQNAANIIAIIFRWAIGSAAALGGVQAVSGASTKITAPKTLSATNGVPFSLRLATAPHQSRFWLASNLPPGLVLTGTSGSTLWYIEGVPNTDGNYNVALTAKEYASSRGDRVVRTTIAINVISIAPSAPTILGQPTNTVVNEGQTATLKVIASGSSPMSYTWRRDGSAVPGGTNFTLSFTPAATNHSGNYDVVLSNHLGSVTSVVANLLVKALPLAQKGPGVYNGLFWNSNNVAHASSGFFTATVKPTGDFTAKLQNGKKKFSFRGKFDAEGHATNEVARTGTTPLTVELHLDAPGGKSLSGRITDGTWSADLVAKRASFHAKTNPATALAGKYTLLIPGAESGTTAPLGDGAAAATITPSGLIALSGTAADGSRLVSRVTLSGEGDYPLYIPLYSGRGAIFGWLNVAPTNETDITGGLTWIRPAGSSPKFYTNGFTMASLPAGMRYVPFSGTVFPTNSASVVLTGGNLTDVSSNLVTLATGGKATSAGAPLISLTVSPGNGLFRGTAKLPEFKTARRLQGAVLQGLNFGGGYFLGTNEAGRVYFGQ